jgi:hypothetical protein
MQEVKNDKKQESLSNQDIVNGGKNDEMPIMGQDDDKNEESLSTESQEKSKIYLVELMFIFPILIVADILDIFSLTGIGAVLSWAMDLIAAGITSLWLWWKGRRAEWNLIANLIEFIPVVDILPWRTTMMIILLVKDSKTGKQTLSKIEKVGGKNRVKSSLK